MNTTRRVLIGFFLLVVTSSGFASGIPALSGGGLFKMVSMDIRVTINDAHAKTTVWQTWKNTGTGPANPAFDLRVPYGAKNCSVSVSYGNRSFVAVSQELSSACATGEKEVPVRIKGYNDLEVSLVQPGAELVVVTAWTEKVITEYGNFVYVLRGIEKPSNSSNCPVSCVIEFDCSNNLCMVGSKTHGLKGGRDGRKAVFVPRNIYDAEDMRVEYYIEETETGNALFYELPNGDRCFSLYVPPPDTGRANFDRSIAFVVDRSGSMGGDKMANAKAATLEFIRSLTPRDLVDLCAFDDKIERPVGLPALCTEETLDLIAEFLFNVDARGGTRILAPLVESMANVGGKDKASAVILLTDGQGEDKVMDYVTQISSLEHNVPLFAFAIGSSVDSDLLTMLADMTGGEYAQIIRGDDIIPVIRAMKEKFDAIVARDLQVQDLSGLSSVYPRHKAFVFEDEPLYFCGRIGKSEEPAFKLGAVTGEGQWSREVELEFEGATRSPIAGELWAELRLNELKGKLLLDPANEEARRGLAELSKDFPMLKPSELGCFIESKGPLPSPSAVPNLELRETPKGVPTPSPKPGSSKGRKPAKSPKPTATPRRSGR